MYIVAFASQKGGVGKSTLARAAAVALTQKGLRVRLCDLDTQQGTSIEWYRRRLQNSGASLASVEYYATVSNAVKSGTDLKPAFDALIVDAPGRASEATLELALAADVLVQPATGTLDDLDPGIKIFHQLRKRQVPASRLFFALTRTSTDHEELLARDYLEEAGYSVLKTTLPERAGYKAAQNDGLSVVETPFDSLNQRANALLDEIFSHVHRLRSQK
jgi:chromosome partitioning protein